jgi:hypothetical protein
MFRFLHNVCVKVLKMFSTFYHNLDIRALDKIRDFLTSFEIYTILKPFCDTIFIIIREQNV